ncbi:hypothetical protein B0H10DRAFT_1937619 [Mycena sp. CBHHK59/15]|nr:hypothetical protein B0H10DRAFT_1937619 [Mycena sp. CBHHK59/15]
MPPFPAPPPFNLAEHSAPVSLNNRGPPASIPHLGDAASPLPQDPSHGSAIRIQAERESAFDRSAADPYSYPMTQIYGNEIYQVRSRLLAFFLPRRFWTPFRPAMPPTAHFQRPDFSIKPCTDFTYYPGNFPHLFDKMNDADDEDDDGVPSEFCIVMSKIIQPIVKNNKSPLNSTKNVTRTANRRGVPY